MKTTVLFLLTIFPAITVIHSFAMYGRHMRSDLNDAKHGVKMGVSDSTCDDAITDTGVDWDESPVNYTCYEPREPFEIERVDSIATCVRVTEIARHKCMSESIIYNETIPTSGNHRPLWPIFGEYLFVPPQRWVHSLEHGAVVMLYHPCTHPQQVSLLRSLVTTCLRKHIITPSTQLTRETPLALVTWGCKMLMNEVDENSVVTFIKTTAMKAPEAHVHVDGQYSKYLMKQARPVFGSDMKDSNLCPLYVQF